MIFPGRSPSRFTAGANQAVATPGGPANLWSTARFADEIAERNENEEQSHYVRGHRLPVLIGGNSGSRDDGPSIPPAGIPS